MKKLLTTALLVLTSCSAGPSLAYCEQKQKSEKAIYSIIGSEYRTYVEADTLLTAEQKHNRLELVREWGDRLVQDSLVLAVAGE